MGRLTRETTAKAMIAVGCLTVALAVGLVAVPLGILVVGLTIAGFGLAGVDVGTRPRPRRGPG